jgi:E3 ubiquitin-protein ligase RNF14
MARLVAKYEEERANREYLESQTTKCPTCEVFVQKSLGCNHVSGSKSIHQGLD